MTSEDPRPRGDVFSAVCPSRRLLADIAGKWPLLVLDALSGGEVRTGDLRRRVDGISQRMLTETLNRLITMNLVTRHSRASVPPHVTYMLTPLGADLVVQIGALDRWVEDNLYAMLDDPGTPS